MKTWNIMLDLIERYPDKGTVTETELRYKSCLNKDLVINRNNEEYSFTTDDGYYISKCSENQMQMLLHQERYF